MTTINKNTATNVFDVKQCEIARVKILRVIGSEDIDSET